MQRILKVIFFAFLSQANAQESKVKTPTFDFYWQLNSYHYKIIDNVFNAAVEQFPNSPILTNQFDEDPTEGTSYWDVEATALSFGVSTKLNINKLKVCEMSIRLGSNFFKANSFGGFDINEKTIRIDSSFFPNFNGSLVKDSVYSEYRSFQINSKYSQVKADILMRFRKDKRLTFFSGFGVGLGINSARKVTLKYDSNGSESVKYYPAEMEVNQYMHGAFGTSNPVHFNPESTIYERYSLATVFSPFFYIPYGIDWQIGKKSNFAKRLHVYYEGQVGERFVDDFLEKTQSNLYFSNALGLRISI